MADKIGFRKDEVSGATSGLTSLKWRSTLAGVLLTL